MILNNDKRFHFFKEDDLMNRYSIETRDGVTHDISVLHGSRNDPLTIYVDQCPAKKVIRVGKLYPSAEVEFQCAGEQVRLISFANQEDLVYNGYYVKGKKPYKEAEKNQIVVIFMAFLFGILNSAIPIVFSILVSPLLLPFFLIAAANGFVISLKYILSPFSLVLKSFSCSFGITGICWLLSALFSWGISMLSILS